MNNTSRPPTAALSGALALIAQSARQGSAVDPPLLALLRGLDPSRRDEVLRSTHQDRAAASGALASRFIEDSGWSAASRASQKKRQHHAALLSTPVEREQVSGTAALRAAVPGRCP